MIRNGFDRPGVVRMWWELSGSAGPIVLFKYLAHCVHTYKLGGMFQNRICTGRSTEKNWRILGIQTRLSRYRTTWNLRDNRDLRPLNNLAIYRLYPIHRRWRNDETSYFLFNHIIIFVILTAHLAMNECQRPLCKGGIHINICSNVATIVIIIITRHGQ